MGYVFLIASCYSCKRLFTCNPDLVPSLTINGEREPFCRACIEAANPEREKRGFKPIVPHRDAYEAAPEYCDGGECFEL